MIWITVYKFIKPFIFPAICVLAVFLTYTFIYNKGFDAGKDDGYSKAITETRKMIKDIPKCPEIQPCNAIDFDKLNAKKGIININNHQHITANMDSTFYNRLLNDFKAAMDERDMVRVKKR